jgi:uncharacterized protein
MKLTKKLIEEARKIISKEDASHDFSHALRVLDNAKFIASREGGNLEIIIPAALFHDIVIYPKNHPASKNAANESAIVASKILAKLKYPKDKITLVKQAIIEHSYSKGIKPTLIESKILQDADRLECTGAIAIMRSFSSTGQMKRKFYCSDDPFCDRREPNNPNSTLDFIYSRLLKIKFNTNTANKLAKARLRFIQTFLRQLRKEISVPKFFE